jgi:hypothetical protein
MNSSAFGPACWDAMFFAAAGYDLNGDPPEVKNPLYKQWFSGWRHIIPCRFCRQSYGPFFDQLDIDRYFDKKCGLIEFVYDLKNLVNLKLKKQEFAAALEMYEDLRQNESSMTRAEVAGRLRDISKIFYTKDAPPLQDVIDDYMRHQAKCSAKMKTCRKGALQSEDERKAEHAQALARRKEKSDAWTDALSWPKSMPSSMTETMYYQPILPKKLGGAAKSRRRTKSHGKSRSKKLQRKRP